MESSLDQLLGPGVVYAQNGSLRLNETALLMQIHRRPARGEPPCYCPVCKALRDRQPEPAPAEPTQPWQPRPPRNLALCREILPT